jgi:hypothetical protein
MLAGFRSMSSVNHLNSWRLNDGLVPVEYEDGQKDFFTGSDGELVRSEYLNGNKQYYEGKKGEEHIVRVEFPGGEKSFFEGKKGEEHLVRIESSDGNKQYYKGKTGEEHLVRIESSDGNKQYFIGKKGEEELWAYDCRLGIQLAFAVGPPPDNCPPPADLERVEPSSSWQTVSRKKKTAKPADSSTPPPANDTQVPLWYSTKPCRYGSDCRFWKQHVCNFYHENCYVQQPIPTPIPQQTLPPVPAPPSPPTR